MRRWFFTMVLCMMFLTLCGFDSNQNKVYDEAELLTESERKTLQEDAVSLADKISMDVVIVTTNDTGNMTTSQYAEYFYSKKFSFGYEGAGGSGILFLNRYG